MFAVIQYQQQLAPGQHHRQRLHERHAWRLLHSEGSRHGRRHQLLLLHGSQLHQPRPISEPPGHPSGHLRGQPRLPHPARTGHRHQPVLTQQADDPCHLLGPAHETRQDSRKPMRPSRQPACQILPHSRYDTCR